MPDVRALRAAVEETRGADVLMSTDALPRLRASVLSIDKLSARLAHHLLLLCEGLTGGAALTRNGSGVNEESRALVAVHAFLGASLTRPDAFVIFEGLAEHGWTDARFAAIEAAVARAQNTTATRVRGACLCVKLLSVDVTVLGLKIAASGCKTLASKQKLCEQKKRRVLTAWRRIALKNMMFHLCAAICAATASGLARNARRCSATHQMQQWSREAHLATRHCSRRTG